MKFQNQDNRTGNCTVTVTTGVQPLAARYMASDRLSAFGELFNILPVGKVDTTPQTTWKDQTQFIFHGLAPADSKSLEQQIGVTRRKTPNGLVVVPNPHEPWEMIAAQVISLVHDRICGKFQGSSFTYNDGNTVFTCTYRNGKFVKL